MLFALPLLSASLSAASAWASIARPRHLQHPLPPGAPQCCLQSWDTRGEVPVPIPGLKPCTQGVNHKPWAGSSTQDQLKGGLALEFLKFFSLGILNCSTIVLDVSGVDARFWNFSKWVVGLPPAERGSVQLSCSLCPGLCTEARAGADVLPTGSKKGCSSFCWDSCQLSGFSQRVAGNR